MYISIGSDHAGYEAKEELKAFLSQKGYDVKDKGAHSEESVDYPDFAKKVAKSVSEGETELGVLVCGTGLGMSMTANKYNDIRAAKVNNEEEAEMARRHNNANVLTFGARIIGVEKMKRCLDRFLGCEFEGGRHGRRVSKINR